MAMLPLDHPDAVARDAIGHVDGALEPGVPGHVELASLPNLRDLGGHPTRDGRRVRTGLLYRSTDLSRLDVRDGAVLAGLGIRTVYDLRTREERTAQPDRLPDGATCVVVDVLQDSPDENPERFKLLFADPVAAREAFGDGRGIAFFEAKYRQFVRLGSARAAYGRLFSELAGPGSLPALFHCTTGKDRTGWAAAALLLLLGVPEDVVERDYLRSNATLRTALRPVIDEFASRGGDPEVLLPLAGVRSEYLAAALEEVRGTYGTIERYFADGLGIDAPMQRTLRATFTEL
jgi:protein-tyrosine phosphatase